MTNASLRLSCVALLAGLAFPLSAHGQWTYNGAPVCTASGSQGSPKVVPDGAGGAVVFWVDGREGRPDLYAQRLTSDGGIAPGWPVNGVFLGTGATDFGSIRGIPDGTGGAIVVWVDNEAFSISQWDLYAQRVTGQGRIATGWPPDGVPISIAPKDQRNPRIAPDGTGGAYIAWYDLRNDPTQSYLNPDVYAQRVTADGNIAPGWPVDGMPISATPSAQWEPTLAPDGSGGAIITWYDERNLATTGSDIFAQRIIATGEIAPGWITNGVAVCAATGHQVVPETVSDDAGGAILIWLDGRTDPDWDLYAQRILGDGTLASGWPADGLPLSTAPGYQYFLDAAADGMGGALVVWEDYTQPTASDIYLQRVTGEGAVPPGWPPNGVPVCAIPGFQIRPVLAPDGFGGAFVAWEDPRNGLPDIYGQHVTAAGGIALDWMPDGLAVCSALNGQRKPAIAADGGGGAIVVWDDSRSGGTNSDIFAHKLNLDGPVGTLLSLASSEVTSEWVVLLWSGHGATDIVASLERRTSTTDWETLGAAWRIGADLLRYEDRSVVPGTRYAYRLAYRNEVGEHFTDEIWVDVPALVLSLAGFRPNPAVGTPTLAFTLPDDRPARLDLIDVKGRVVSARDVGSLGGGLHVVSLAGETPLRAGMYWIRLTHPERTLTAKGLVVR